MGLINGLGKPVSIENYFENIFDIEPAQLCNWDEPYSFANGRTTFVVPIEIGVLYFINPYSVNRAGGAIAQFTIRFLDENMNAITWGENPHNSSNFPSHYGIIFSSARSFTSALYRTLTEAKNGIATYPSTTTLPVDAMYIELAMTDTTGIKWGVTKQAYVTDEYLPYYSIGAIVKEQLPRYWEQFKEKLQTTYSDVIEPMVNCSAIRKMNETDGCVRIGTFNLAHPSDQGDKVDAIKQMFADYGLDFIGVQEVYASKKSALVTKTLPYIEDAEVNDSNTNAATLNETCSILSRYKIESSARIPYENLGGEVRAYVKSVVKLPRYRDYYPDGDQYLSIYCTHLDLYLNRPLQMEELRDAMLADTNRFVVAVMDSNDFTAHKYAWKILTDAGFTQVHDGMSKTAAKDATLNHSSSLDQIFCNANMTVKRYDIIRPYTYDGTNLVSDHDMVFADFELDYGDLTYTVADNPSQEQFPTHYHITRDLTHVKDSIVTTNYREGYRYQSTLTADDGYEISSVTVIMGGSDITATAYNNGQLDFTMAGDVVITAVAAESQQAEEPEEIS